MIGTGVKCLLKEIRLKEYMQDSKEDFAKFLRTEPLTYEKWEDEESIPTIKKGLEITKILNKTIEEIWQLELSSVK